MNTEWSNCDQQITDQQLQDCDMLALASSSRGYVSLISRSTVTNHNKVQEQQKVNQEINISF